MGKEEKKHARDKPPRPRNAWMLFLCAYHDERKAMREPPLIDPETAKHTKIVSERWKNLPMSEKEKWHAKAEKEKEEHAARYPGYRYQPSKHRKQRTFYGGPKAQRKMQSLVQTAQAKIQQDVGGRLIWVDVAENGQSIAGQVELYDAPELNALSSSVVGIHPYDHALVAASHSPVFLSPVAQYSGPLSERTNSLGPDSDDDEMYSSVPPESDWENDGCDEDDAELRTPDSATHPRRPSGSDSLRIVMTVQNRLGTLTEVDAGVQPSDPGRPLSPPIPVMQLIRNSRKRISPAGEGLRRNRHMPVSEDADRHVYVHDTPLGRGRSHSTPTLSSSSPSPQSILFPVRPGRAPCSPNAAQRRSSESHESGSPPLASPLAPPLSAQPYVGSPHNAYAHSYARRHRDYPPSPSQAITFHDHAPHPAHPYNRPPDTRSHGSTRTRPAGPLWLPPPGSGAPPLPPAPGRRPSWLPSLAQPTAPPSRQKTSLTYPTESHSCVKREDINDDMSGAGELKDVLVKREPEGEDVDELDDDQYPEHKAVLSSHDAVRDGLQLAPIRSPPSSPKGDIRLPPIRIPHTHSSTLSPRSLPASAYLKGPAPGSLGQYSPQHAPSASAGTFSTYRLQPGSRAAYREDHREREIQGSRATPMVRPAGRSHTPAHDRKTHHSGACYRGRSHTYSNDARHPIRDRTDASVSPERAIVQRMQSPIERNTELRSSSITAIAGADTFTLRPARF